MTAVSEISARIEAFRRDLDRFPDPMVVQKHITFGESYLLGSQRYFELKSEVSLHFDLHPSQVVIVGSGKLGFSIAPGKQYQHFNDESDLDLAVVSSELFDRVWIDVFEYSRGGAFWPDEKSFKDYLLRGWVRPDKLPPSPQFPFRNDWWDFFQEIESFGRYGTYKIRAGIYKSWYFLESYQSEAVKKCRETSETDEDLSNQ